MNIQLICSDSHMIVDSQLAVCSVENKIKSKITDFVQEGQGTTFCRKGPGFMTGHTCSSVLAWVENSFKDHVPGTYSEVIRWKNELAMPLQTIYFRLLSSRLPWLLQNHTFQVFKNTSCQRVQNLVVKYKKCFTKRKRSYAEGKSNTILLLTVKHQVIC